jgi:hypothetical protein
MLIAIYIQKVQMKINYFFEIFDRGIKPHIAGSTVTEIDAEPGYEGPNCPQADRADIRLGQLCAKQNCAGLPIFPPRPC